MPKFFNPNTGEVVEADKKPSGFLGDWASPWQQVDNATPVRDASSNQQGVGVQNPATPVKDATPTTPTTTYSGPPPNWIYSTAGTDSMGGVKQIASGQLLAVYTDPNSSVDKPTEGIFTVPSSTATTSVAGLPGVSQRLSPDGQTIEYRTDDGKRLTTAEVQDLERTRSTASAQIGADATLGAANIGAATSRAITTENIEAARLAATALDARQVEAARIAAAAKLINDTAAIKKIDSDIQRNSDDTAIAVRNLQFAEDKNAYANSVKNTELSRDAQKDIFAQQTSIANLKTQQVQMFAQRDQAQATLNQTVNIANAGAENETGRFNTTQQFNVQRANEEAARARQQQLQSLGTDIGKLAADPGDRAKYASTVLANSGWGRENTAMAGQDLRTTDSMAPLEALLRQRESVQGQTANPYTYTPLTVSQIGKETLAPIDLSGINLPSQYKPTEFVAPANTLERFELPKPPPPPTPTAPVFNWAAPAVGSTYNAPTATRAPTTTLASGQVIAGGWGMAYGGGTREGEFIVGDSRSGRPTGYEEIIVNPTHAPIHVIPNHDMSNYFGGTMNQYRQMPRYAEGAPEAPSGEAIMNYLNAMTQAGKREAALKILAANGYKMDEPEAPPAAESRVPNIFERTEEDSRGRERSPEYVGDTVSRKISPEYVGDTSPELFAPGREMSPEYVGDTTPSLGRNSEGEGSSEGRFHYQPAGDTPGQRLGNLAYDAGEKLVEGATYPQRMAVRGAMGAAGAIGRRARYAYGMTRGSYDRGMGNNQEEYDRERSLPRNAMGTPSYAMGTSCPTCGSPNFANGTMPVYADGTDGVFGGLGADTDRSLATSFLNDASSRARAGTPWSQGNLPTSVYASSPGFNPSAARTLASIRAQATGQSSEDFLRSANLYKPGSVSETTIGRRA